jgi:CheY-like chemotaxis protein/predicted regulator of Ras-like GTPase activity (Roadblock/LC7/MglB family)
MAKLLIVDDEIPLLHNLASYLGSFPKEFTVLTAASGENALATLQESSDIDILLTDVRLPGIDGIELVRQAVARQPDLGVVVMTAYPSASVRQGATAAGALRYLEKPLDLKQLRRILLQVNEARSGWSGSIGGLDIFDFTQLFIMSGKSRAIRVSHGRKDGVLVFLEGNLVHASSLALKGDDAFFAMATWSGGVFEELDAETAAGFQRNVNSPTSHLMMEAARMRDEERRGEPGSADDINDSGQPGSGNRAGVDKDRRGIKKQKKQQHTTEKENNMAIKDQLAEFQEIAGFQGAAVFTAQGEMLDGIAKGKVDIKTIGMFANNALLNAQKATDQMGVGRGNLMQIRAPKATVLMRCLNEATDFAATKEGKAHIHAVVVMEPEGNVGMATMILDKAIAKIADEVR